MFPDFFHYSCFNCRSLNVIYINFHSHFLICFDSVASSETHLHTDSNVSLFEISDFALCHVDRKLETGGGVALYVINDDYYSQIFFFLHN